VSRLPFLFRLSRKQILTGCILTADALSPVEYPPLCGGPSVAPVAEVVTISSDSDSDSDSPVVRLPRGSAKRGKKSAPHRNGWQQVPPTKSAKKNPNPKLLAIAKHVGDDAPKAQPSQSKRVTRSATKATTKAQLKPSTPPAITNEIDIVLDAAMQQNQSTLGATTTVQVEVAAKEAKKSTVSQDLSVSHKGASPMLPQLDVTLKQEPVVDWAAEVEAELFSGRTSTNCDAQSTVPSNQRTESVSPVSPKRAWFHNKCSPHISTAERLGVVHEQLATGVSATKVPYNGRADTARVRSDVLARKAAVDSFGHRREKGRQQEQVTSCLATLDPAFHFADCLMLFRPLQPEWPPSGASVAPGYVTLPPTILTAEEDALSSQSGASVGHASRGGGQSRSEGAPAGRALDDSQACGSVEGEDEGDDEMSSEGGDDYGKQWGLPYVICGQDADKSGSVSLCRP
jgi:hypothetical protein